MTNSQKFVYELYQKQSEKIITYLKLCNAKREYQSEVHSKSHSFYTYKQKEVHTEIIKEIEAHLISNRISLQKLQKINRCIKKVLAQKELPDNLDYITQKFIKLYFSCDKVPLVKAVEPSRTDMQRYSKIKAIKRHLALKNLDTQVVARIINRRLTRLYFTLYPKGKDCFNFVRKTMFDVIKNGEESIQKLVDKARSINPNYNYY